MKRKSKILAATMILACGAAPLRAQTSAEDAQKLQAAYETYLGKPDVIALTPDGDAYRAQLDLKKLFAPFNVYGFSLDAAPMTWTVKRQADGSLLETIDQMPDLHWRTPLESADLHVESLHATYILDAALPWLRESQGTAGKVIEDASAGATQQTHTEAAQVEFRQTATAEAPGVVTSIEQYQSGPVHQHGMIALAAGEPSPIGITIDAAKCGGTRKTTGLQAQKLLDIWTWLVAHPSRETIAAHQDELKELIRKASPVFAHADRASAWQDVKIATPYGTLVAAKADLDIAADGIIRDGTVHAQLALHDASLSKASLPAWVGNLVPKEVSLDATLSGYDAPKAMDVALNAANFAAQPVLSPDAQTQVWKALVPGGHLQLVLGPSHLKSSLLDVEIEGTLNVTAGPPDGALVVKAKGVADLLKAMSAGPQDHLAQQIMLGLIFVKGYAQTQGDGTLVWHVAFGTAGVTVNGNRLKSLTPAAPRFQLK
ncbi:hypothetical protein [Methylovirgula sp. 4M-Z18]|uniref:hypothetical protein n=1 Tax=Methylovirgula sp. 4M-Z18 TaxID=2293567 RepID=UPI000E2F03F2|nr:hypothetical protein [Methylovirgula sp. 4M-Z18]